MRRIIALIFVILFCFSVLTGCEQKEEVSRDVIDCRYTAAHDTIETDYDYKYDVWSDEFRLMPNTHTVHHDAITEERWVPIIQETMYYYCDVCRQRFSSQEEVYALSIPFLCFGRFRVSYHRRLGCVDGIPVIIEN